jgi:uncharacterized repeat protein (TIGR01451 family)
MKAKIFLMALVLIFVSLGSSPSASMKSSIAGTWYVSNSGSDSSTCQIKTEPCATINAAISKASPGDTIFVAVGRYSGSSEEVVLINKDVNISGGWDQDFNQQEGHSIINGELARRGITISLSVTSNLDRFIIEKGEGEAILIYTFSAVRMDNFIVRKNRGRIYIMGNVEINDSLVMENWGGGIRIDSSGRLVLNNSSVYRNISIGNSGAGIDNGGSLTVNNSTISGNYTDYSGGGIAGGSPDKLAINSSTITNNTASYGGGLLASGGKMGNTIIAGNTADSSPDCMSSITSAGYNLIGNSEGCTLTAGMADLLDQDPILGPILGRENTPYYHPLLAASPAINAGDPNGCTGSQGVLETDQRDAKREGNCDIGAYEYRTPQEADYVAILHGSPQHTRPGVNFRIPFQAAVLDTLGSPVGGVQVTFSAPSSGASGFFEETSDSESTVLTPEDGIATAPGFTANELMGDYWLTASAGGVPSPALFGLSNSSGVYVAPGGDNNGKCLYPNSPCGSIDIAGEKAIAGDQIFIAEGKYTVGGYQAIVTLDRDLVLSGGWNSDFTSQSGYALIDGQSAKGGLIIKDGVTARLERLIIQNGSSWFGGGIRNHGTLSLDQVVVRNNQPNGIYTSSDLFLVNSSIIQNDGDGIWDYLSDSIIQVSSSTIMNNHGTGIRRETDEFGEVYLRNTLVAKNGQDCSGDVISEGYNLIGDETDCNYLSSTGDLLGADVSLDLFELHPDHYLLLPGNPAIDAGDPGGCRDHLGDLLPVDQRSKPRYGRCEIGAIELQPLESMTTMKASRTSARRGDVITFTIDLSNPTLAPFSDVHVNDILPGILTYIECSLKATTGTPSYSDGTISWQGAILPGQSVTIIFDTKVHPTAPFNETVVNRAAIDDGTGFFTRSVPILITPFNISIPLVSGGVCFDFFDDFSRPSSGWYIGDDSLLLADYFEGEYRVVAKSDEYFFLFDAPTCLRDRYTVEVDVHWEGITGYMYGLIFGLQGDYDYLYWLSIRSDEKCYSLDSFDPQGYNGGLSGCSDAINSGYQTNHLKVTHSDPYIIVEVNGRVILESEWPSGREPGGRVGLVMAGYDLIPNAEARFDNFRVVQMVDSSWSSLHLDADSPAQWDRNVPDHPACVRPPLLRDFIVR